MTRCNITITENHSKKLGGLCVKIWLFIIEVSSFPDHKDYYNQCAKRLIEFCEEHGIAYHIKDGTL